LIQLLLFVGLALLAVYAARRYFSAAKASAARGLLWLAFGLLALLALTGRLGLLIPLLGALLVGLLRLLPLLLPALLQWLPVWLRRRQQGAYAGQGSGDISTAESEFLRMRLDHASGEIGGEILKGRYAGKRLSELRPEQLVGLYQDYARQDRESAALLQAYLDRVYGGDWQDFRDADQPRPASSGKMSAEEARQVLGLDPGASREEIIAAHRRLMQRLHPDRGGSDYLAAKINQAKDALLGH
jgi:hypothetical protein